MPYFYDADLISRPKVPPTAVGMPSYLAHNVTNYPVSYDQLQQVLVTKSNYLSVMARIIELTKTHKPLVGIDIESHDNDRHAGLNEFMCLDPKSTKFKRPKKLIFDLQNTTITGFSIYLDQDHTCYYFNTGHADVDDRIDIDQIVPALCFIRDNCTLVAHNATYEISQFFGCWGFDMGHDYICTLTMAVSAYNDDEYPLNRFTQNGLGGINTLMPALKKVFYKYRDGDVLTADQEELIQKILGKQSVSSWSYNGLVRETRYGYGLKEAVKSWFGHQMTTFQETLNGKAHMGQLTSHEASVYGADDSYWCIRLFYALYDFMQATNPKVFSTFIKQENPMARIFAKSWQRGIPVNHENIYKRRDMERANYAQALRDLQAAIQKILPFESEPNFRLVDRQKWYVGAKGDSYLKYRQKIIAFAGKNFASDNEIILAVSGPVTQKLANELHLPVSKLAANFAHYMMQRTMLHDLCDLPFAFIKGELKTDKAARGKLREKLLRLQESAEVAEKELFTYFERKIGKTEAQEQAHLITEQAEKMHRFYVNKGDAILALISALDTISTVETRMKLFINPYLCLTDPNTHRMYPLTRSELNTRRMSSENPNAMQLSKNAESSYIRGFWLPQNEDHVILSLDWSQVELVLVGSASNDPGFTAAFGQIPYNDLHAKAAASAIAVKLPGFTEFDFQKLHHPEEAKIEIMDKWGDDGIYPFKHPVTGEYLDKPFKTYRGLAKALSFGFWFSGNCFTAADGFGWSVDETFEAGESYKKTFPVAERWRLDTIEFAKTHGYVMLPDGHRRTRYESTVAWFTWWVAQWRIKGLDQLGIYLGRKIQRRAGNQVVNARIQGTGATLAKRSAIKMDQLMIDEGGEFNAYFMMPIHDELVFSVHKDHAIEFAKTLKSVMCTHPDIVSKLKLDGTCSLGLTLEPYDKVKAPYGQIELDEAPVLEGYVPEEYEYKSLPDDLRQRVVDYLFNKK